VPRSHDDVVFDAMSNATAYTATVNAVTGGIRTKALTIAGPLVGNLTLAGSTAIVGIHGNVTLPATGLTRTYGGAITLSGSTTGKTFTPNGVTATDSLLIVTGVGCGWTLGSATTIGSLVTVTDGSFDTGGFNLTASSLSSSNSNSRTINLNSSTVTLNGSPPITFLIPINLTFNAGTSLIVCSTNSGSLDGGGKTFYNVSFTNTATATLTITGVNTFNNLTVAGRTSAGIGALSLTANQTINGTLTLSAGTNATMRNFVQSDTIGTTRTLTCAAFSGTDADFRDITIAGAAAPISGTRLGDCKGNSGITFGAGVTRYWNLVVGGNWSATGWAASSGASPSVNNFPLAQDTCIFEATGLNSGNVVTFNANYNIGTINMSARTTNTMTLSCASSPSIYGNWINGTGTTLSGTSTLTFSGRGSQTITSAGKTFTPSFLIDTPSGSVTLQDAFQTNRLSTAAVQLARGTFDANGYNVTLSSGGFYSSNSNIRTLAIGSGTWTIAGIGTTWEISTSTNLTVTGTGTITMTSASGKAFYGGGISYSGITLNQGGVGLLTMQGNNTFANITNTYSATGATILSFGTTTQRVANFTATGEAGRVLTIQGSSATSPCTLIHTSAGNINLDYVAITGVRAYQT
jgi:hypothetical protein